MLFKRPKRPDDLEGLPARQNLDTTRLSPDANKVIEDQKCDVKTHCGIMDIAYMPNAFLSWLSSALSRS